MDDVTIQNTPIPKAASTHVNGNRIKSLRSFESSHLRLSSLSGSDESSLGLVPDNLLALGNASIRSTKRTSSKPPNLPSVSEFHDASNVEISTDEPSDEVFMVNQPPDAVNGAVKASEDASLSRQRFSISDLSNIDFCDQQISARSSIADSEEADASKRSKRDLCTSVVMSNLFRRHTLDVSEFIPASGGQTSNQTKQTSLADCVTLSKITSTHLKDESTVEVEVVKDSHGAESSNGLEFYIGFGDQNGVVDGADVSFAPADIDLINQDQKEFEVEHRFSLPVVTNLIEPAGNIATDAADEVDNWRTSMQDITRPSWMPDEPGSRVSIGKLFASRGASIGSGMGGLISEGTSEPYTKTAALPEQNGWDTYKLNYLTRIEEAGGDTLNSQNEISAVLNDISLSDDTVLVSQKMFNALTKNEVPLSQRQMRRSDVQQLSRSNKISSATVLTPIPSVSDAMSPLPSESVSTMDKSIQTCNEKPQTSQRTFQEGNTSQKGCPNCAPKLSCLTNSMLSPDVTKFHSQSCFASPDQVSSPPDRQTPNSTSDVSVPSVKGLPQVPNLCQLKSASRVLPINVVLPADVQFETCCVGISSESTIKMQNRNADWLDGCCKVLSVTLDGQDWNTNNTLNVFNLPQSWDLQPNSTQSLSVVFCPAQSGSWEVRVQFYFRTMCPSSNVEVTQTKGEIRDSLRWEPSSVVTLRGTAEKPNLTLTPRDKLDFGIVTEGSLSVKQLQLRNDVTAPFPVRLFIDESLSRGTGYYFPVGTQYGSSTTAICSKKDVEIGIPIAFKAPRVTSSSAGPFQLFSATLRIELDGISPNPILGTVNLSSTVGAVRLFAELKNGVIQLNFPSVTSHKFPLHNQGGVPLNLELTTKHPQHISVFPNEFELLPGGRVDIQVLYHPQDHLNTVSSTVLIKSCPEGTVFEIPVHGLPTVTSSVVDQDASRIQCDRKALVWGTVPLGRSAVEKLTLRNPSTSETLNLSLTITTDDESAEERAFYWSEQTDFSLKKSLKLSPGQESVIQLRFSPLSTKSYLASLVVKPRRPPDNTNLAGPWLKYTIPLSGHGGVSMLRLIGLKPDLSTRVCDKNEQNYIAAVASSRSLQCIARNDGERAAVVKIVCSLDASSFVPLPPEMSANVQPSSFVLQPGANIPVKMLLSIGDERNKSDFYLLLCTIDDVLWQRFVLLQQNGVRCPLPRTPHFMEQFLFDTRDPQLSWSNLEAGSTHLPRHDDMSRLSTYLKLHRIKVKVTSVEVPTCSQHFSRGFETLPREETFTEVTHLEGADVTSSSSSDDPLVPTVDSCIRVVDTSITFPETHVNQASTFKLKLKNLGNSDCPVCFVKPEEPFHVRLNSAVIKANYYLSVPVRFQPTRNGVFRSHLRIQLADNKHLPGFLISLQGNSL